MLYYYYYYYYQLHKHINNYNWVVMITIQRFQQSKKLLVTSIGQSSNNLCQYLYRPCFEAWHVLYYPKLLPIKDLPPPNLWHDDSIEMCENPVPLICWYWNDYSDLKMFYLLTYLRAKFCNYFHFNQSYNNMVQWRTITVNTWRVDVLMTAHLPLRCESRSTFAPSSSAWSWGSTSSSYHTRQTPV